MTEKERIKGVRLFSGARRPFHMHMEKYYTAEQLAWLVRVWPGSGDAEVAAVMGETVAAVKDYCLKSLGLRKSEAYRREAFRQMGERRRRLCRSERLRAKWGVEQLTRLRVWVRNLDASQRNYRSYGKKNYGYIPGDVSKYEERLCLYWDGETRRSPVFERHAAAHGMKVMPAPWTAGTEENDKEGAVSG